MSSRKFSSAFIALNLVGVAAGALTVSSVAHAQAEGDAGAEEASVGDIVVTARRREEALNSVPVAVSAYSADDLDAKQIVSTRDLVLVTPGLNISQSGNFVPYITIRGQTRGLTGPGTPGVITYVNEVPLDTIGSLIPTFDMGNLQVLKGPQGTLFGRNATGGAILAYTKPATYEAGAMARVSYAEQDTVRAEAAVNLPIIDQVLAIRLAGEFYDTAGFTKTTQYSTFVPGNVVVPQAEIPTRRNFDAVTTHALRGTILFEPAPGISNTTVVDYLKYDGANNSVLLDIYPQGAPLLDGTNAAPAIYYLPTATIIANLTPSFGAAGAAAFAANIDRLFRCNTGPSCNIYQFAELAKAAGPRRAFTDLPVQAKNTLFGISNVTKIELSDSLQVKNIFGYRRTRTFHNPDVDGTPFPISETASRSNNQQFTNELQFSGDALDKSLQYVVGGFYLKSVPADIYGFSTLGSVAFGGLSSTANYSFLSNESKAIYAQIDYALPFLEGLGITAGYRQTWDKASGCAAGYGFSPFATPQSGTIGVVTKKQCESGVIPTFLGQTRSTVGDFVRKSNEGTYTIGLNWQIKADTLAYVVARRGYRAAGYNVPTIPPQFADALQTFDPDVLTDVEIGLKSGFDLAGMRGNVTLAAYRGKDKGYQTFLPFTGTALQAVTSGGMVNIADLTIQGVEGALTVQPVRGLTIGGDFSYTDIKVDRIALDPVIAGVFTSAGRTIPSVTIAQQPKWQANANISYTLPADVAGGELTFDAQYHYQTSFLSSDVKIPGYQTVNAKLTLAGLLDDSVDIAVFARNLFDEFYYAGPQSASGGVGVYSLMAAPPRQIGAQLTVRWGGEK